MEGKVILITGALGQAGQSAVRLFLNKGAAVIAGDCADIARFPDMARLQGEVGEQRFLFMQADMNEEDQVSAVMAEIDRRFGRLDGCYHNVYASVEKAALELSLEEWESSIRGTLTSTFLVCKHVLPLMIKSGGGAIVNTSSVRGHYPDRGCIAYGAAKAGVNQFTRMLAADYADHGIRANVIVPGDFKSEEEHRRLTKQDIALIRERTLLKRSGTTDEVSEVAAFLLSDAASYVTASLYSVDGGYGL